MGGERQPPTPSQTVGPYFGIALTPAGAHELVGDGHLGTIFVTGTVRDGAGTPVHDGVVELWQADEDGEYSTMDTGFTGFGRCHTTDEGRFQFRTVKPGPIAEPGGTQAPHLNLSVYGTGLLKPVRTRMYFADEGSANAVDPVLSKVDPDRRHLLIGTVTGARVKFDIVLQGADETPFFDA